MSVTMLSRESSWVSEGLRGAWSKAEGAWENWCGAKACECWGCRLKGLTFWKWWWLPRACVLKPCRWGAGAVWLAWTPPSEVGSESGVPRPKLKPGVCRSPAWLW
jgi:hypothetical protein